MTAEAFRQLHEGDLVRSTASGETYRVMAAYGDHVIAVRVVEVSRRGEWDLLAKGALVAVPAPGESA